MQSQKQRLQGLDLARFLAFVGMVIVNFRMAMGIKGGNGPLAALTGALEGRAAACFVVLAGIGLGIAAARNDHAHTVTVTLRRALFLLVLGLCNMLLFEADILHYYAFYFVLGALLLKLSWRALAACIAALDLAFVALLLTQNYSAGWDWHTYTYSGFWTPAGFGRNLLFNGWHPVLPWLGFLLLGMLLGKLPLAQRAVQHRMMGWGALAMLAAESASVVLRAFLPDLSELLTTKPIPPMPLYMLAASGSAVLAIGLCLRSADWLHRQRLLQLAIPAGRQTLTLYIAHVLLGMGTMEALGLLEGQSLATSVTAALIFCVAATVYAWWWSRHFERGPVEALMRRLAG
ncbi:DUF418 domain-containing protein [Duganella sp. HH101]|uniref:DUF418 domain-containing protein n=1 Tax=Duganella sp. HH101 TaxID=1781066 RepID=UPI00087432A9|nr:DUF418 domain-containing protein [Duganella sp. HH101]OFA07103.1 hypothetical protein DUGA2_04350 [Duganella sp. HH101]